MSQKNDTICKYWLQTKLSRRFWLLKHCTYSSSKYFHIVVQSILRSVVCLFIHFLPSTVNLNNNVSISNEYKLFLEKQKSISFGIWMLFGLKEKPSKGKRKSPRNSCWQAVIYSRNPWYLISIHLGLLVRLLTVGAGAVSDTFFCFGGPFSSYWGALSNHNMREGAQSHCNLICLLWLIYLQGLSFSKRNRGRKNRSEGDGWRRRFGNWQGSNIWENK